MAYKSKDLSVLAYGNGFTLWHYRTDADDVKSPDYFNPAFDMLREGDELIINSPSFHGHLFVRSMKDGKVEVA